MPQERDALHTVVRHPARQGHHIAILQAEPFHIADDAAVAERHGDDLAVEAGQSAAQLCGLMLLAQIKKALGDLERVERIVKLGVFVTSTPDFTRQPEVANGASELMLLAFGEAGRHARSAVGVPALPRGAAVEIDAVVAVK